VRQSTQKCSARKGLGAFRQEGQTGIRERFRRRTPQTRQSSGKTRLNSAVGSARTARESMIGLKFLSHRLEKIHLHRERTFYHEIASGLAVPSMADLVRLWLLRLISGKRQRLRRHPNRRRELERRFAVRRVCQFHEEADPSRFRLCDLRNPLAFA
jgi:hypothetical protein